MYAYRVSINSDLVEIAPHNGTCPRCKRRGLYCSVRIFSENVHMRCHQCLWDDDNITIVSKLCERSYIALTQQSTN